MTTDATFPELSCYLLPGHSQTPADAIEQARAAEAAGLGRVWLSERYDVKEAGVICSAALTVTERLRVATAATNLHTRHPLLLASMCSSLHYLSGGRFELGIARGVGVRNQMMGLEPVTNAKLEEGIALLRKLWKGREGARPRRRPGQVSLPLHGRLDGRRDPHPLRGLRGGQPAHGRRPLRWRAPAHLHHPRGAAAGPRPWCRRAPRRPDATPTRWR